MYKIISISNKPHTVVYVCNHLSLPLFQSYDYAKILKFINKLKIITMSKLTNTFKLINSTTIKLNNQIYTLITKSETENYKSFIKYNNNYYSITN